MSSCALFSSQPTAGQRILDNMRVRFDVRFTGDDKVFFGLKQSHFFFLIIWSGGGGATHQ